MPPGSDVQTVDNLREATRKIVAARSFKDLGPAAEDLAAAVEKIGVRDWPRYLADAESRAKAAVAHGILSQIMSVATNNKSETTKFSQNGSPSPELASVNHVLRPSAPRPGPSAVGNQSQKVGFITTSESEARRKLGMSKVEFGDAVHNLKDALGLGAGDNLEFHIPSGDVSYNGEHVGNLFDE